MVAAERSFSPEHACDVGAVVGATEALGEDSVAPAGGVLVSDGAVVVCVLVVSDMEGEVDVLFMSNCGVIIVESALGSSFISQVSTPEEKFLSNSVCIKRNTNKLVVIQSYQLSKTYRV